MVVDFTFVEIINDYLNNQDNKSISTFDLMYEKLSSLASFSKMIEFYKFTFSQSEYREVLKSVLLDEKYESSNEMANMLYTNLLRIKDRNLVNRKIVLYKQYDFNKLQDKLQSSLPEKCNSMMEVYFVYDGINGGSIVGENQMMINFMLWPSSEASLSAMEGVLLHEAHHLGMIEIYTKKGIYQHGKKDSNVIRRLIIAIVTEGIATYLFNQNNSLSELIGDSHGLEFANQFRESESVKEHEVSKLIKKLNSDLSLMKRSNTYEENVKYLEEYCCNYDGGHPLDKAIGVYICKVIDKKLGRERLIELLSNPSKFINEYNNLVESVERIELEEEMVS